VIIKRKYKRGNLAKSNIPIKPITNNCKVKNLSNQKFGKLSVLKPIGINSNRSVVYECFRIQ